MFYSALADSIFQRLRDPQSNVTKLYNDIIQIVQDADWYPLDLRKLVKIEALNSNFFNLEQRKNIENPIIIKEDNTGSSINYNECNFDGPDSISLNDWEEYLDRQD